MRRILFIALAATTMLALPINRAHAQPSTSTVTYQGVLTQGGVPVADNTYTLTFKVWDTAVATPGQEPVESILVPGVQTTQGRFAALVPVTPSSFNGADRWWSVTFNGTELPRQKVTAAPYAMGTRGIVVESDGTLAAKFFRTTGEQGADAALYFPSGPNGLSYLARSAETDTLYMSVNGAATARFSPGRLFVGGFGSPRGALDVGGDAYANNFYFGNSVRFSAEPGTYGIELEPDKLVVKGYQLVFRTGPGGDMMRLNDDPTLPGIWCRRNISTPSITIRGGSDLAEPFAASPTQSVKPEPGMVLSIDPQHPGKLRVSTLGYDRKVAGVYAGGNGLPSGMVMGKDGCDLTSIGDDRLPVAMTGRVWVFVDESAPDSTIQPGDRLTTSGTRPGYAMKVIDESRAPGAVIGKAMTGVDSKTGMVLVLVNLQ